MNVGPKILFLDTENAMALAGVWGIHEQRIRDLDIIHDWFFLSGQWAWDDSKQVNVASLLDSENSADFSKDFRNDRYVVEQTANAIREADLVVGHNINGHDIPKLTAKIIEYRLPPLPPVQYVDTYQWVKRLGFTSKKLSYLCKKLDLLQKKRHEDGAFIRATMGDREAIHEIAHIYGPGDIPTVRELYYELRPYFKHPNHNLFRGDGVECCPKCGSTHFQSRGFRHTAAGKYPSYQCQDCKGWFQTGKSVKRVNMR